MPASSHTQFSLDELAGRTGISSRTIRFYTSRGLIAPPQRRGRSAAYNEEHLVRLELIRELQEHGFGLAAIESHLDRIPLDAPVSSVALHGTLLAPWLANRPELLSSDELVERSGRSLTDGDLHTLESFGVIAPSAGGYSTATALLPLAMQLIEDGFDSTTARSVRDLFERYGRAMAKELASIYNAQIRPAASKRGATLDEVSEIVDRFKPISVAALVDSYERAVEDIHSRAKSEGRKSAPNS
ncbi:MULTISPECIES: MerR family transcriptional regulator [unclassified Brevibacterium]|uniref:MerR family transcriptional regulator n=1 Tax=unclassified Brevibacterium TaxID=2614124 RepID=UPI00143DC266|nr:MerR family transcriptional regulator [Brevibacterium sp. S22]